MGIMVWTDARISELTRMHGEGASCRVIAEALGGTSRNAVIGKVFRLGLTSPERPKPEPKPKKPSAHRMRQRYDAGSRRIMPIFESAAVIQLRCVEIVPRGLSLLELEPGDCRYPFGDEVITFCGHPKIDGSSYCKPHHALCMTPAKPPAPRARIYYGTDFAA